MAGIIVLIGAFVLMLAGLVVEVRSKGDAGNLAMMLGMFALILGLLLVVAGF